MFVVQSSEVLGHGRHAFGRYLLNRLALPDNAVFVAALEDPSDVDSISSELFDVILPVTKTRPGRLSDEPMGAAWQTTVESLRSAHVERFGAIWPLDRSSLNKRFRRYAGKHTTASISMANRPSHRAHSQYVSFASQRHFVLDAPTQGSRQQQMALVSAAALTAVEADYGLIPTTEADGEPRYSTIDVPELSPGRGPLRRRRTQPHEEPPTDRVAGYGQLLNHGDAVLALHQAYLPIAGAVRAFDIEKPLRAAAFAGFVSESRTTEVGG